MPRKDDEMREPPADLKSAEADSIVRPDQFNEKFTLYLNGAGKPVERMLSEMTSGEVMRALEWHGEEDARLEREAAPFIPWAEVVEAGGSLPPDVTRDAIRHAVDALRASGEMKKKHADLLHMVGVMMPQWQRQKMPLGAALRRFWPGGRAAR
jgi:hypothetical protein